MTTDKGSDRGYYHQGCGYWPGPWWLGRRTSVRLTIHARCKPRRGQLTQHRSEKEAHVLLAQLGKSQANEGMWGMPGHIEAMKAAVSCDKLGGAAHTH